MIHIGFGDSATDCIKEAMLSHGLSGIKAIASKDDFTQGPIEGCSNKKGLAKRISYWERLSHKLNFGFDIALMYRSSIEELESISEEQIAVWPGFSAHDILATGWLLSYFEKKEFKWNIVDLSKLDQEEKIDGRPVVNLAMYRPEMLPKLFDYIEPMSVKKNAAYKTIWAEACKNDSAYRILMDGTVKSVGPDHFDDFILSNIPSEFELTAKLIGNMLRIGKSSISDTTLEWNIRKLINRGTLIYEGNLSSMRSYSVKRNV